MKKETQSLPSGVSSVVGSEHMKLRSWVRSEFRSSFFHLSDFGQAQLYLLHVIIMRITGRNDVKCFGSW